jgi:tetratricopeptide (TPR) repeat protein
MQDLKKGIELAGRYTLVRKLGTGGAAQTWLARDRLTRAAVAVKILVSESVSAADFHREWQTSLRLIHPHIVRVFEFHEDTVPVFYSQQFIDGPDIGVLSGAPLADILPPVALIADALRYAHGKGIVHRDVKGGNVLVDRNGAPYLVDFGVASVSGGEARGGSLIAASPQALAGEPAQPADDIFALGGLIYELVSGASPYSSSKTAEDIRDRVPAALEAADGSPVPDEVRRLVARMLDKAAPGRPAAAGVVAALDEAGFRPGPVAGRYVAPASARADADEIIEIGEVPRAARRTAAPAAAPSGSAGTGFGARRVGIALAVLLAVLIGVVFVLPHAVQETQPPAPAPQPGAAAPSGEQKRESGSKVGFSENVQDLEGRDERVRSRADTDAVLGELLSKMDTLERRAVERWGGLPFKQAKAVYAEADKAYLARDYDTATAKYKQAIEMLDPLLDQVDGVFAKTYADAQAALEAADAPEALRLFELAVAISPSDAAAQAGYRRAKNLDAVLALTSKGLAYEKDLELEAARQNFAAAAELDPQWKPAAEGLERVKVTITQTSFDSRMSEGLAALADHDFEGARAAFRMAQKLKPESPEPADGLLQVDQGLRLEHIADLQSKAGDEEKAEEWEAAVDTYKSILDIDANLEFALEGLAHAQQMTSLHEQLKVYIDEPDALSAPATMSRATALVVDITRMSNIGPRLADERDQLSRLLKRAATPLTVQIVSDDATEVSIYKVGHLGSFRTRELDLRPGTYVAVGSRPGYRDVRLEFRVAPEIEQKPIVVQCEETI